MPRYSIITLRYLLNLLTPSLTALTLAVMHGSVSATDTKKTQSQPDADSHKAMIAYLKANCFGCHNATANSGNLDLGGLQMDFNNPAVFRTWVKIHDRVQAGEMPPKSVKNRPNAAATGLFLKQIQTGLATAEQKQSASTGRTVLRRMNRIEYENTLRDLLHLPGLNVHDMLPDDGRAYGYDKSGSGLEISAIQMTKYMEAADFALDQAIANRIAAPQVFKERIYPAGQYDFGILLSNGDCVFLKDRKFDPIVPLVSDKYHDFGAMSRDGLFKTTDTVGVFRHQDEAFGGRFSQFSPLFSGRYKIRFSVWSYWWDKGEVKPAPRCGAVGLYYGGRQLGHYDAPSLKPTVHEIETYLEPGDYLSLNAASLWPIRLSETAGHTAGYMGPGVAVDWLEVEGPLNDQWPPASHQQLFGTLPLTPLDSLNTLAPNVIKPKRTIVQQTTRDGRNQPGPYRWATVVPQDSQTTANRLLADFLPKAFRRPVGPDEVRRYLGIVNQKLSEKASFEDAMRTAYRFALCSPDFLFLRESPGALDDYAIASRLSYFLWESMPDDTLFTLAQQKRLHSAATLHSQVDRMLKDAKSERFVQDFVDQWLDLRLLDATTPDKTLYPEYGPYLRDAIKGEPVAFFRELVDKDLPTADIVDSDFLFLNQRLAEHYGITSVSGTNVSGTTFRKVGVPPSCPRGGMLTQAAVLKVTANGTTTSPVKRGAWVLRRIMGLPPDPPPANVVAIEPDVRGATTVREQLAKHRSNPTCASCHAKIDPPGFALESFDVIGGLRDRFRATAGKDGPDATKLYLSHLGPDGTFPRFYSVNYKLGLAVDAAGETANGRTFTGIDGYKKLLRADEPQIARNLVNQLTIYATGAPTRFSDRPVVDHILAQTAPGKHGIRSLIQALVQSPLFLNK